MVFTPQNYKNHLDSQVFPSSDDWKDFSHILETIDHINIESLPRQQYIEKGSNIYESYEGDSGEMYNRLYMPEDVTYGELLFFIDFLTQKFQIEAYSKFDTILTKVKILIWLVLRESGHNQEIFELAQRYHLDESFLRRIQQHRLRPDSTAREYISKVRKSKTETPDVEAGTKLLSQALKHEFSFNFLRRGLEIVRMGMMTMTQEEQEILYHQDNDIEIHVQSQDLDKSERLLREKIGIDKLKEELASARATKNSNDIERIEKNAVNRICRMLYEYPYQLTIEKHGYKLNRMIRNKELFCVWTALLGHAFLSELQIQHRWVEELWHARLDVYIWQVIYKFEPSLRKSVVSIWYISWNSESKIPFAISGDPELLGLAQIMNSKWLEFLASWKRQARESKYAESIALFDNAIHMFDMALEFCPEFTDASYYKAIALIRKFIGMKHLWMKIPIWEYDAAIKIFEQRDTRNPRYNLIDINNDDLLQLWEYVHNLVDSTTKVTLTECDLLLGEWDSLFSAWKFDEAYLIYDKVMCICWDDSVRTPHEPPQRTRRETLEKKVLALYSLAFISRENWNIREADSYAGMARSSN